MNTRRLRLVRPRWTMGTMLLSVGWSSVVVWLNVRPHRETATILATRLHELTLTKIEYGCPWSHARVTLIDNQFLPSGAGNVHTIRYWPLAGNVAIGMLTAAVLTFASKYLFRHVVSGFRAASVGKPPPSNAEKGPERQGSALSRPRIGVGHISRHALASGFPTRTVGWRPAANPKIEP